MILWITFQPCAQRAELSTAGVGTIHKTYIFYFLLNRFFFQIIVECEPVRSRLLKGRIVDFTCDVFGLIVCSRVFVFDQRDFFFALFRGFGSVDDARRELSENNRWLTDGGQLPKLLAKRCVATNCAFAANCVSWDTVSLCCFSVCEPPELEFRMLVRGLFFFTAYCYSVVLMMTFLFFFLCRCQPQMVHVLVQGKWTLIEENFPPLTERNW